MDMTTKARVKALVGFTADTTYDALIDGWIAQISAAVEKAMNRVALAAAQIEYFNVNDGQTTFFMNATPVTAWTEVNNDVNRSFASGTVVSSDSYATDDDIGMLQFHRVYVVPGPKVLKVSYTGGMAASTAAFITAFPDIAGAIDAQVAYHVQRRAQLGATSFSADGGSVSVDDPTKWLPPLKRAVDQHRRIARG